MNVLVVGGCGFIGSNLVKRLCIRKHLVSVIDIKEPSFNLLEEGLEYHKIDAASAACKEVFEIGHFDAVIYTAGTLFGKNGTGYGSEFGALVNILNMCVEYNVKKLIYISTTYLNSYRPIPESPYIKGCPELDIYCANKMMCEYYCKVYSKLYNLKTSIIRLPPVYGPGQDIYGEGGIVLRAFKNTKGKECLKILAYGNIIELSYINDVSEKLYELIYNEESGIFGFRGIRIDAAALLSKINGLTDKDNIEIVCIDETDMKPLDKVKLLNTLEENTSIDVGLDRSLSWFSSKLDSLEPIDEKPCINPEKKKPEKIFRNGIFNDVSRRLTYLFAKAAGKASNVIKSALSVTKKLCSLSNLKLHNIGMQLIRFKKRHIRISLKKYRNILLSAKRAVPWVENLLLCLLSVWISERMSFPFDPRLICIMITGLLYGVLHSFAAVGLCTVFSYILTMHRNIDVININTFETIGVYFFIALISGFSTTGKIIEIVKLRDSFNRLEQLYLKIRKDLSDKRKAASLMAEQIRTSENSFGKMLVIIRSLKHRSASEILQNIPEIVFELTGFSSIGFYLASEKIGVFDFLCSKDSEHNLPETIRSFDFSDKNGINAALNNGDVYINTLQDENSPNGIIPILNHNTGGLAGIITIKHIPFMRLNVNTEYMLNFTGEFLSYCLTNTAGNTRAGTAPDKGGFFRQ